MNPKTVEHLRNHIDYPATGEEILKACNNWADVPAEDKEQAKDIIDPDKTYNSADEVITEIELETTEEKAQM